jgi:hypothetical protein
LLYFATEHGERRPRALGGRRQNDGNFFDKKS